MILTSASGSSMSAQGVTHTNSHRRASSSLVSVDAGLVGVFRLGLEGLDIVFHFLCFIMYAEMDLRYVNKTYPLVAWRGSKTGSPGSHGGGRLRRGGRACYTVPVPAYP